MLNLLLGFLTCARTLLCLPQCKLQGKELESKNVPVVVNVSLNVCATVNSLSCCISNQPNPVTHAVCVLGWTWV